MREIDLPAPGCGGKGFHLRRTMVAVINYLEVYNQGGYHSDAALVKAMLNSALIPLNGLTQAFTPDAKTYSIAAGPTAGPTFDKGSTGGAVTYSSSDTGKATVNSSTGAVTGVAVGTAIITASVAASGDYPATTRSYVATITA